MFDQTSVGWVKPKIAFHSYHRHSNEKFEAILGFQY